MKKEVKKQNVQDTTWTDVHNDTLMVELGFRCPKKLIRDPDVWIKTSNERRKLREARNIYKDDMHTHTHPFKHIPVKAKIIIYLKKNNKYPKTTYSKECWQSDIPFIISKYRIVKNGQEESAVAKYSYNGKTYRPDEIPYWFV